ncbi:MAG: T9SS type A sorting domain-containing protein [Bacteroidetes bacterium]|nr:T9SS type A sorting domain-containing protein [Bacteroidota bacterium]
MSRRILLITAFFLFIVYGIYAKPDIKFMRYNPQGIFPSVIQEQIRFDANNIDTWIQNTGIFDQDIRTNNTPGMMWPKGSNRFVNFTSGLTIGTYVENVLRLASCSYKGEYEPGYINISGGVPTPVTNTGFKLYKVTYDDSTSQDYVNWGLMVPYGAPYVDRNNNGQYDAGIDRPGIMNAAQTVFICMTDGFPETHNQSEGFSGGTTPIFAETHLTAWAYRENVPTGAYLPDVQFLSYEIINKSTKNWNNTVIGIVGDPDLGDANDDYIGCDSSLNLGYCYNSDNMDGTGNPPSYGANPPAFGMNYLLTPLYYTGNMNDSVVYYTPPGSAKRKVKKGYKESGMTSFVYFTGSGSGEITCEQDPSTPIEAYRFISGIKKDGSSWFHPITKQRTKKVYTGNPETGVGWTEFGSLARIKNCIGGDTVTAYPSPPGDRKFVINTCPSNFTVNAGDTVRLIFSQMVARGTNNLNAVTRLKRLCETVKNIFIMDFNSNTNSLPLPVVKKSVTPLTSTTCALNLYWGDECENYWYHDSINHLSYQNYIYRFQGYEVYELNKNTADTSLPDFARPITVSPEKVKLLTIYDKRDEYGVLVDTLPTGVYINGSELYSLLPIVPPYGLGMPAGFPNSGLSRLVNISQTQFPQNYGGNSSIQYGQTYKFIVLAYAVTDVAFPSTGSKVIRNPVQAAIITITPQPPPGNVTYNLHNGDTINTNRRDLGLKPVVVGQEYVLNATYRVMFRSPDTAYSILRTQNNWASVDTLKSGLKVTPNYYGAAFDSSRIYDGILFKTDKIRSFNVGIVKDPTVSADSFQTRYAGYQYLPVNQYLTGSKYYAASYGYQSRSMSISYPYVGTFNNISSLLKPYQLRKVKIVFSNTNKQYAYRYRDTSSVSDLYFIYQSATQVPFRVYMIDSTAPRQLNCAFVESNDVQPWTGGWAPGADTLGRKLLLYIFNSSYDTTISNYKTKNLFITNQIDVMYVYAPRLLSAGANFTEGDSLIIYPYQITMPGTYYEFSTVAPTVPVINISTEIPEKYDLMQNYPNPFNPSTKIRFNLPENADVTIRIFDMLGRQIRTLVNRQRLDAGTHQVEFDGAALSSGVYFYRIETDRFTQAKRMVLIK